jgi:hypothetical protein
VVRDHVRVEGVVGAVAVGLPEHGQKVERLPASLFSFFRQGVEGKKGFRSAGHKI